MNKEQIDELNREIQCLRIITHRLEERTRRLERENQILSNQVRILEGDHIISEPQRVEPRVYRVGDRICIKKPTCLGRNRAVIPLDGIATVTRVDGDWVYYTADSGVKTKPYPCNIQALN